jgi:dipeptide/tripeptide permease
MSQPSTQNRTTTVKDVEQLGTFAALASLSYVFWICGGMEMIERLAFYGVRSLAGLYGTDAVKNGGLGLTGAEIGTILSIWYFIQGLLPVFTGGLSDRLGYKETIAASTVIKILGYLLMAWLASFWGFFAGAIVLAIGTAIFKPGIQGTIAKAANRKNSAVAWGIFYQTVNIGAFLGPVMAGYLRQTSWDNVFYACAAIISLNFLMLLTYREVDKDERIIRRAKIKSGELKEANLIIESWREFTKPTLLWFMLLFTGWWFMMLLYWDLGPLYFRDWVDTSVLVQTFWGNTTPSAFARGFWVMDHAGTRIMPEGLININSIMIMLFCFLVMGFSARLRAANSMAIGTAFAATAFLIIGGVNAAWLMVIGVIIFSIGEMLASPKSLEFLGNIAPDDKKAMYLGFYNLPFALGALFEGFIGQYFYGKYAAKDTVARSALENAGMSPADAAAVPVGEAFERLIAVTGQTPESLTNQLYISYDIGSIFYAFATIGLIAAGGLYAYGRWTYRTATN